MQCLYHQHDEQTGEYSFVISSVGNDAIQQNFVSHIGKDEVGEARLNYMHFKPIKNENGVSTSMECTHAMAVNPGAVPSFIQGMISKAHAKMLTDIIAYMIKNKERLMTLWNDEIKEIVDKVYESQRP